MPGTLRLLEEELSIPYGKGKIIFIDHMNDLWASEVPDSWIAAILEHCNHWPENTYIFQTKNPDRYLKWIHLLPPNHILGCTIETTDSKLSETVSDAPSPVDRALAMLELKLAGERTFVTIEPILDGDMTDLADWCESIDPEFINIGADSKGHNLKEPTREKVDHLIKRLTDSGLTIRRKTNLERLLG